MKKNKKKPLKNMKVTSRKGKKVLRKATALMTKKHYVHKEIPQPSHHFKSAKALVYLVGESPLIEQYTELCADHGYDVCVSWNKPPLNKTVFKSPHIKISNTVPHNTSLAIELTNIDFSVKKKNIEMLAKALPETAPILSSSITVTATEQATWITGKHRLVGISVLPTFIDKPLVEVAPTIYSPMETLDVISRFFHTVGKEIEIVQDRVGMVLPRILCQVINEAAFAVTEDIAMPQDIDKALTMGMQFPLGPIRWAEQIGLDQVYAVLKALHLDMLEERYRIAPLLKQLAVTGMWWKQTSTN